MPACANVMPLSWRSALPSCNKYCTARAAALLAFSAVARQERVAGLVLNGDGELSFPATRTLDGVLRLLRAAIAPVAMTPSAGFTLSSLERLDRAAERGSSIYLIGDFHNFEERQQAVLRHLAERCEITAIQAVDPAEEQLSSVGRMRFSSPTGQLHVVDTDDARLRERYAAVMAERAAALQQGLHGAGVSLVRIHTHDDVLSRLDRVL